jgi:hypothetical protein
MVIMSKKQELVKKMLENTPPSELDRTSKSTFYEAYNEWEPQGIAKYTKITHDNKEAEAKNITLGYETQQKEAELEALRTKNADESKIKEQLITENTALQKNKLEAQTELGNIQHKLDDLEGRGLTEPFLTSLLESDVKGPDDLLQRVKTRQEHAELAKQNAALKDHNTALVDDNARQEKKLSEAKKLVASEANRADEIKRKNETSLAIIEIIFQFIKRGYDLAMLKGLLEGLRRFEVEGDPRVSVKRLLDALEKTQTLLALDALIKLKTNELETLRKLVAEAKGIFEAYKNTAIATLGALETNVKQRLEAQYQESQRISAQALTQLKADLAANTDKIMEAKDVDARLYESALSTLLNTVAVTQNLVEKSLKRYEATIEEWGKIKAESGRTEQLMQQAAALLAFQKDPAFISRVPPGIIVSLQKSIDVYIKSKLPAAETTPSQAVYDRDHWGLNRFYAVKVSTLTSWLVEDLTKRLAEGTL